MPPENIDMYIAIQVLNAQAERSSSVLSLDEVVGFLVNHYSWLESISRSNLFLIYNFANT